MTTDEQLKILHQSYPFLNQEDMEVLLENAQYRLLKNKEEVIRRGELSYHSFFILSGMMRGYFINKKGEEKNIFLRPEHTISGAPDCLFENKPTRYTFEAILATHVLIFDQRVLLRLAPKYPHINQLYIAALQENIQTLVGRVEALTDQTPAERYEELLKRSPQFFQRAFHKHIANYLGITPVSLSRIINRRKSSDS